MRKIFSLLSVAFIAGCGVKGGPYPPFTDAPETIRNASIKQQDQQLIVYWNYIPKYADGRPMKEGFRFEIYSFDHRIIKKISKHGSLYWFRYRFLRENEYCFRFKVITVKQESKFSKYFCYIPTFNYPKEPPKYKLDITQQGIKISWENPSTIDIYKIPKPIYYPKPYLVVKNKTEYLDSNVTNNRKYCYYLTIENQSGVESAPSDIKCVTYKDIFPPLPPQNPRIIKRKNTYYLIWSDSPSKDVTGYLIFINEKQITPKPVYTYSFILKGYKKGNIVKIIAVDRAGNKSKPAIVK
ncbi:lipoprotein [Persephonella sp.]|uniref:lipoprotein n=1 Tax=Persephonella sp. TaxID=2060922 RepID=UPI0026154386|nr:lipoprotein [Persephonella sp.]